MNAQSGASFLTPEHRHELVLAKGRTKAMRKAASVAAFNGWSTGIIASISAPFALFSAAGFLMTMGLAVVAYNEFRGRKRLLALDPASTAFLGWNQIGFFIFVVAYCLWMLFTSIGSFSAELQANPELEAALGSLDGVRRSIPALRRRFLRNSHLAQRDLPRGDRVLLLYASQARPHLLARNSRVGARNRAHHIGSVTFAKRRDLRTCATR